MLRLSKSYEYEVRQLLAQNRRLEAEDLLRDQLTGSRKEIKKYLDTLVGKS